MKLEDMESIKPGNPFTQDLYHMGSRLGNNLMIMYDCLESQPCKYFIIVDCTTGERKKVIINEDR